MTDQSLFQLSNVRFVAIVRFKEMVVQRMYIELHTCSIVTVTPVRTLKQHLTASYITG